MLMSTRTLSSFYLNKSPRYQVILLRRHHVTHVTVINQYEENKLHVLTSILYISNEWYISYI